MSNKVYVNETVSIKLILRDADGNLYTPSALVMKAIAPSGTTTTHELSDSPASIFAASTGTYLSYFTVSEFGTWVIWYEATRTENSQSIVDIDKMDLSVYSQSVFS